MAEHLSKNILKSNKLQNLKPSYFVLIFSKWMQSQDIDQSGNSLNFLFPMLIKSKFGPNFKMFTHFGNFDRFKISTTKKERKYCLPRCNKMKFESAGNRQSVQLVLGWRTKDSQWGKYLCSRGVNKLDALFFILSFRGAFKWNFWKNLGFCPNQVATGSETKLCLYPSFLRHCVSPPNLTEVFYIQL